MPVSRKAPSAPFSAWRRRLGGLRSHTLSACICLLAWAAAATAQTTPETAIPLTGRVRHQIVFVLDRPDRLAQMDRDDLRVHGIDKILYTLGVEDQVGLVTYQQLGDVTLPLRPVTDLVRTEVLQAARNVSANVTTGSLDNALSRATQLLPASRPTDVHAAVILITAATLDAQETAESAPGASATLIRGLDRAGVALYAIAVGDTSDKARLFVKTMARSAMKWYVKSGVELPAAFGDLTAELLGYAGSARGRKLDPAQVDESTTLVPAHVQHLHWEVQALPEGNGFPSLQVTLVDPSGREVRESERFRAPGTVLYRVPLPEAGRWTLRINNASGGLAQVKTFAVVDHGFGLVTYFPRLVVQKRAVPLHFVLVTREGPIDRASFTVEGARYRLVEGRLRVTDEKGGVRAFRADLADRSSSQFGGEYIVGVWRSNAPGTFLIDAEIILRRENTFYRVALPEPWRLRVTMNSKELPLVGLTMPTGGAVVPIVDAMNGGPEALDIRARVLGGGRDGSLPFSVGRFVKAQVQHGTGVAKNDDPLVGGRYKLAGRVGSVTPGGVAYLMPDARIGDESQYAFPNISTPGASRIFIDRLGYYQVALVEGATYRTDPATSGEVVIRAGEEPVSAGVIGLIALGVLVGGGGGLLYLFLISGRLDMTPPPPPVKLDDVLIEEEAFQFVDVLTEVHFKSPLNIPSEVVVFEDRVMHDHTILEHQTLLGGNYTVHIMHGNSYLNDAPIREDFDLHMHPGDRFRTGDFVARIVGVENPDLPIQFQVEKPGSLVVNAITTKEEFRWTITRKQDTRVPPRVGETTMLDFADRDVLTIARDEGFTAEAPYDLALYHESVGNPHARLIKMEYMNKSIGYNIEAVKGSLYVNDKRLEPGQSLDEIPSGASIAIGKLTFRLTWSASDPTSPEVTFLEAPENAPPAALPSVGSDFQIVQTGEEQVGGQDLDALFGELSEEAAESHTEETSLDALGGATGVQPTTTQEPHEEAALEPPQEAVVAPEPPAAPELGLEDVENPVGQAEQPQDVKPERELVQLDAVAPEDHDAEPAAVEAPGIETAPVVRKVAPRAAGLPSPAEAPSLQDLLGQAPEPGEAPPEAAPATDAEPDDDVDVRTGLPTPASLEDRLDEDWQVAAESDLDMSLILVDLERALGDAGDDLVPEVAELLRDRYSQLGYIARADVALFSILLSNVPLDEAVEVANVIRESLRDAFPDAADDIIVGVTSKTTSDVDDVEHFMPSLQDAMEHGADRGESIVVYGA